VGWSEYWKIHSK